MDDKNMGKMREMTLDLTVVVFSNGWTSVNHHPIVKIIMGVRALHTLRSSIDTMGQEKTMDFITALILEHIKEIGEDRVHLYCSASARDHILSIEGWIHSNKRNRLGQKLVDHLVHTRTNLKLEQRLEMYEDGLFQWDIVMTVEEPVSDDDDESPHRVFDSESESESEQDSD
jgi:hypothetical protein